MPHMVKCPSAWCYDLLTAWWGRSLPLVTTK